VEGSAREERLLNRNLFPRPQFLGFHKKNDLQECPKAKDQAKCPQVFEMQSYVRHEGPSMNNRRAFSAVSDYLILVVVLFP
jgi:hypothetical protein